MVEIFGGEVTCGVAPVVAVGTNGTEAIEEALVGGVFCVVVAGGGVIVEESASVVLVAESESAGEGDSSVEPSEELLLLLRTLSKGRNCHIWNSMLYVRY